VLCKFVIWHCKHSDLYSRKMNKLCRQVSIESPLVKDCVFKFEVPVPDVPVDGAKIKVACAGACYRNKNRSSISSSTEEIYLNSLHGIKDGALFPGFEVSGVIDELGERAKNSDFHVGDRVVLYPHDDIPHGYSEYIVVPNTNYMVKIPDNVPLSVAAMLPTGALLAKNAVISAHSHVLHLLAKRKRDVKILIVGTGGLALWAMRIAAHHFTTPEYRDIVKVTVASLKDDGFKLAKELLDFNVVQWNEGLYETQLIERTKDACSGPVDIVINFGTTRRSLQRALKCLNEHGVILVNEEVAQTIPQNLIDMAEERYQTIQKVPKGDVEQLRELVKLVSEGEIIPPPHEEYSAEEAGVVVHKLRNSEIPGRAILRFADVQ